MEISKKEILKRLNRKKQEKWVLSGVKLRQFARKVFHLNPPKSANLRKHRKSNKKERTPKMKFQKSLETESTQCYPCFRPKRFVVG